MYNKSYVSEQGAKDLIAFKYKGGDNSLIYKYIVGPSAQKFVDICVPSWLAPNCITALGFLSALIAHLVVWAVFGDQLAGEYPPWLTLFCAVATFVYFFLDNVDGKQARQTGSSSPLGLLFDHGCDSLMPVMIGLNMFAIAQGGNEMRSILGFILATVAFLLPTWESYYMESLDLPIINGAMEGVLIFISVFLFSSTVDKSWWISDVLGIPRNYYFLTIMIGIALPLLIMSLCKVYSKVESKGFPNALSKLGTSGMIIGTLLFVSLFSPTNVLVRKARLLIYIAGVSQGKLMSHFQLAHVTKQEINQKVLSIWIPQILLLGNTVSGIIFGQSLVNEDLLINILAGFVVLAYAAFVSNIIKEFTGILGINAFTIKKKSQ